MDDATAGFTLAAAKESFRFHDKIQEIHNCLYTLTYICANLFVKYLMATDFIVRQFIKDQRNFALNERDKSDNNTKQAFNQMQADPTKI